MDSLTQITLGAAVGESTLGRQADNRAPLWGAALGTLPDLDVLMGPFVSQSLELVLHRSATHSLLFVALASPLLAVLARRVHPGVASTRRWAAMAAAVLGTHIVLDSLTTYGTQVFWPFDTTPVMLATVFVIDPLYTVPLAAGLLVGLRWSHTHRLRRLANAVGLGLSTAYLLVAGISKLHATDVFAQALQADGAPVERLFVKPTALNTVLWTGIAEAPDGFYVGYYSLLDDDEAVNFRYVPKRHELLGDAADSTPVQRIQRFSQGYYVVRRAPDGSIRIHDMRFGRADQGLTTSGRFVFSFRLERNAHGEIVDAVRVPPQLQLDRALLRRFAARIGGQEPAPDAPVR
jgi:inner membrane protein